MADYAIDQYGALRHKECGGQIAIDAELWVIAGFGFPDRDEVQGCRIAKGPHGIAIVRKFGGYRGYCMKCQCEGNFYGPRYRARQKVNREPKSYASPNRKRYAKTTGAC